LKDKGKIGEEIVADYLEKYGFEILARNFHIRGGEIDIIASQGDIIAFVEVKTRDDTSVSNGFDVVDIKKQNRIIKAARVYMEENSVNLQARFDVAVVIFAEKTHINYIKNAFEVCE
jgi:putative endonuclease